MKPITIAICTNCYRTSTLVINIEWLREGREVHCTTCWAGYMILARAVPTRRKIAKQPKDNKGKRIKLALDWSRYE